jgi:hypothetical protein
LFVQALVFALMTGGRPAMAEDDPLRQPGRWAQDYVDRKPDVAPCSDVRHPIQPIQWLLSGLRPRLLPTRDYPIEINYFLSR